MIDDAFFADPDWCRDDRPLTPEELEMDLSLRDPDLIAEMLDFVRMWFIYKLGFAWIDIYEGIAEFPIACPNGIFAYRLCARLPGYPNGTWIHVLMDRQNHIHGARID